MSTPKSKQYKCPSCGSVLNYEVGSDEVKCSSCGHSFPISSLENANENTDEAQGFNWSDYKETLHLENMNDTAVYNCQSCGAVIETESTTIATSCPFCDNNVVLDDRASGGLKPNAIIPFKIQKSDLPKIIKAFYKNKKLLPSNFINTAVLEKTQGVYVPFWLFDAKLDGSIIFEGIKESSQRKGDYIYTTHSFYNVFREGEIMFEKIPVDASVKMENALMDSVEPYNYEDFKDFNGGYLSGFVADRFDSSPDEEFQRADTRMKNSAEETFESTVKGYKTVTVKSNNMQIQNPSVKYVLLPVYLINAKYEDKNYQYAINGQTGKMVGHLPISKKKWWFYFLTSATVFSVIAGTIIYYFM